LVMYPSASQGRVGGALHSALLAPAAVDAENSLQVRHLSRRDARERVFNGLKAGTTEGWCRACGWHYVRTFNIPTG
jgi:hypothetical protein